LLLFLVRCFGLFAFNCASPSEYFSTALLEQYDESPYAVRSRLGFVLKRRLHQDSI